MSSTFHNYGVTKSSLIADRVKNLTFHYATLSGISLSIEDLRVPFTKNNLVEVTNTEVRQTEADFRGGNITTVERFQKVIDTWNNANNSLKEDVLTYFKESDPLNPLYIMAFSGARGNISQVRQLVGMRGLMADQQGQIIDLPIKSNFREGLKVTEYIISSYGARKGLVDTALRTADSGYLTRRLVDVAQDIIIREDDCLTSEGLSFNELFNKYKIDANPHERLIGRLLLNEVTVEINGKTMVWPANTEIDTGLSKVFLDLYEKGLGDKFSVRSPLTCAAPRSICRACYGWHLSYSKLVDLGEAVGILAAQSIGEPGTQLTMRTFHTGGVFSGDLTKQIRAPFTGMLQYNLGSRQTLIRTIHGEKGFRLREGITLTIFNNNQTSCSLTLPKGALLLVNNGVKVSFNQAIAEIKKDANLILEEERTDIFTEVTGEVFFQNVETQENVDNENAVTKLSKTTGLIWVLEGTLYKLSRATSLNLKIGQEFTNSAIIGSQKYYNDLPGTVRVLNKRENIELQVVHSSMVVENGLLNSLSSPLDTLCLLGKEKNQEFQLEVKPGEYLKNGQILASLKDDTYNTETGGIIFYSLAPLKVKTKRQKNLFNGTLYWVPEETYNLAQLDGSKSNFKTGTFVKKGEALGLNTFASISGFVTVDLRDNEFVIKPGELYKINLSSGFDEENFPRFMEKGTILNIGDGTIIVQKTSYVEILTIAGETYYLLRPVINYYIPPDKGFLIKNKFFPTAGQRGIAVRTIKRIFYKDGERVKTSGKTLNLLKTFLVLDIKSQLITPELKIFFEPTLLSTNTAQYLKLVCATSIKVGANSFNDPNVDFSTRVLVTNGQYLQSKTLVAQVDVSAKRSGRLFCIGQKLATQSLLVLEKRFLKTCRYNKKEKLLVKLGDLVRVGTYLTKNLQSKYAGQIYKIEPDHLVLHLGRPYLISPGTILRSENRSIISKSDLLATLVYKKLKTVDIVQGLPKVEEILEARKIKNNCILAPQNGKVFKSDNKLELKTLQGTTLKLASKTLTRSNFRNGQSVKFLEPLTDGPISPHDKLNTLFYYYSRTNPCHIACKKSFKHIQLFLVSEVQRTYLSQGVQIADKHIEIIVKQMTSKVKVTAGGDTTLLPGEIIDIHQAETLTNSALSRGEEPAIYCPLLLGLTKASLNSDSFISAASFQETTRVLTEAAIEGKKDWLYGLKENVIIGRLIPAGTGFNNFENLKKVNKTTDRLLLINQTQPDQLKSIILKNRVN